MVTVALIDPVALFRQGVRALLEKEPDIEVVAEGATGRDALRIAEKTRPTVILIELLLPELHGLEVVRRVHSKYDVRMVILSAQRNASYVIEALKAGAAGFVLKDTDARDLIQAIRIVADGERHLSKEIRNSALEMSIGRSTASMAGQDNLTGRERIVLELAAEGSVNSEIAERLTISRRTVESHRASLMQKLGLKTQTDLVRYAIRNNIIRP